MLGGKLNDLPSPFIECILVCLHDPYSDYNIIFTDIFMSYQVSVETISFEYPAKLQFL